MKTKTIAAVFAALPLVVAGCAKPSSSNAGPLTLKMEKFSIDAGSEKTQCRVIQLHNAETIDFTEISSQMSAGSHHFILYRDASSYSGQQPPPEGQGDCRMDLPRLFVYGAQEPTHAEPMPSGVAGELPANSTVILEAHYVNASSATIEADVSVTITPPADPSAIHDKAGVIFYMDTTFSVPAGVGMNGAPGYSHTTTCAVPDGLNIFRLQSHGHKRLDDFSIVDSASSASLYDSKNWEEPVVIDFPEAAPLHLAPGGGFQFSCNWHNETTHAVTYGPSVEDEMCIMGAGYWPKVQGQLDGLIFCADGQVYQ